MQSNTNATSPVVGDAPRPWRPSPRFWWITVLVAVLASAALGWKWLVATGFATLLLSVLPCLAMCALGICMSRGAGAASCHGKGSAPTKPGGER